MKRVGIFIVLLILSYVFPTSAMAQNMFEDGTIFLPFISLNEISNESVQSSRISEDSFDKDLHIALGAMPEWEKVPVISKVVPLPDWAPKELEQAKASQAVERGHVITLISQAEGELNDSKVDITIENFEIEPGQSLLEWAKLRVQMNERIVKEIVPISSNEKSLPAPKNAEQMLHAKLILQDSTIEPQVIWFTHGRIVYVINAYSHADQMGDYLRKIAASISIASTAPTSLDALYHPTSSERLDGSGAQSPSLQEELDLKHQFDMLPSIEQCDIVCRDAYEFKKLSTGNTGLEETTAVAQDAETIYAAAINAVTANRKALPANWWTPVFGNWDVLCGSIQHTSSQGAAFALDIQAYQYTNVYSSYGGYVEHAGWDNTGYGNLVRIRSNLNIAEETRTYYHNYAHLQTITTSQGTNLGRGAYVGQVGGTGGNNGQGVAVHMHFHVRDSYVNGSANSIDATPLIGFTPDLDYPDASALCGVIESVLAAPVVIEPVAFNLRFHPRSNHNWSCFSGGHVNECYMMSVLNNTSPTNLDYSTFPTYPSNSPEIRFNNVYVPQQAAYRIWICGRGGNGSDDSLHVGYNSLLYQSSSRLQGFKSNSWIWASTTMNSGAWPSLTMNAGDQTFNVWMREDGLRVGRILLTSDQAYNPTGRIQCGAY